MNVVRRLLAPVLLLSLSSFTLAQAKPAAKAAPATKSAPAARPATAAPMDDASKLDINTASAADIKALPGIGDAYTKRIVDGRPYTAKNQLETRGILPAKTYAGIKEMIVAHKASAAAPAAPKKK